MYGGGIKWYKHKNDLEKMPNYTPNNITHRYALGEKVSNINKKHLDNREMITNYAPLNSSNSHEIGLKLCDKLRGLHLGQYVRRV